MPFHLKYMLCLFVLSSITCTAFALKCWTCYSDYDPECADPFDNSTIALTDCSTLKGVSLLRNMTCLKIRQKMNGEWHYIRECTAVDEIRGDVCLTGSDENKTEYCTCNSKDGCNSSITLESSSLLALVVLPALVVKILS